MPSALRLTVAAPLAVEGALSLDGAALSACGATPDAEGAGAVGAACFVSPCAAADPPPLWLALGAALSLTEAPEELELSLPSWLSAPTAMTSANTPAMPTPRAGPSGGRQERRDRGAGSGPANPSAAAASSRAAKAGDIRGALA